MSQHKTIVVIPARGGSKRLPKKNTKLLGGMPLLAHSVLYAKAHMFVDAIYVSTDDMDIKNIASNFGAMVIDRPKALSGDLEPTVSALKHVLESIDSPVDTVILLQPTNPLRPKALLEKAYRQFIETGCDSLMTVSRIDQKLGKIIDGKFTPFNYTMGQRSQDIEPLYFENGLLYILKASLILDNKILGDHNFPYIVNHPYAQVDIDSEADFEYADYLLKKKK